MLPSLPAVGDSDEGELIIGPRLVQSSWYRVWRRQRIEHRVQSKEGQHEEGVSCMYHGRRNQSSGKGKNVEMMMMMVMMMMMIRAMSVQALIMPLIRASADPHMCTWTWTL